MAEVSNKQVIVKEYVRGFPKESDVIVTTSKLKLKLKLPEGSKGVLVKSASRRFERGFSEESPLVLRSLYASRMSYRDTSSSSYVDSCKTCFC